MKRKILMIVLAAVFLFSAGMLLYWQVQYRRIAADGAEAAQLAGLSELTDSAAPDSAAAPEESQAPEESALPDVVQALAGFDLAALRAVNEDVVGWVAIPGAGLSYPLVQGEDNRYYLNHSWKRERSAGGAVFLESTQSPDLDAFHTIAYAHNMRDGSMFALLKDYQDADFLREHPSVYVATEAGVYRYEVFSAQEAGVKDVVYRLDLEESGLREEFLRYCLDGSVVDAGVVPGVDDRILTLSTCTGHGPATRWVVHCVLAEEWPKTAPPV